MLQVFILFSEELKMSVSLKNLDIDYTKLHGSDHREEILFCVQRNTSYSVRYRWLKKKKLIALNSGEWISEGMSYKAKEDNRVHLLYFLGGWRHFGPW